MTRPDKLLTATLALGAISALALVFQYLAMADIAKEPDSPLEWRIVGACMIVVAAFIILTMVTLIRFLGRSARNGDRPTQQMTT